MINFNAMDKNYEKDRKMRRTSSIVADEEPLFIFFVFSLLYK